MSTLTDNNITPIFGTKQDDTLSGGSGSEVFSGLQGDDLIRGDSGSDVIYGGSGDDDLRGQSGDDVIYGGGGPCYIDLGQVAITENYAGKLTFLNEGAGYRNALGMYKINGDGSVYDVEVLFANASKVGSGGSLVPGVSSVDVPLSAGDQVGFFIVSNGYSHSGSILSEEDGHFELRNLAGDNGNVQTDDALILIHVADNGTETTVQSQYGNDLFHSAASAENNYAPNPDNFEHTVGRMNTVTGEVTLGFEDLKYGGDEDYDDTVFSFEIGTNNAQSLIPSSGTPSVASDDDTIKGASGDDEIYGMAGDDVIDAGSGDDEVWGNSGDDEIIGGSGRDTLKGGKGDDVIYGNNGIDELHGDSGDDTLDGGGGDDSIYGGSGDDTIMSSTGDDYIHGGSGIDTLDFSNLTNRGANIDLHAHEAYGRGSDEVWGIENIIGTKKDDTLIGDKRDNDIDGGKKDDFIRGWTGDDTLTGGDGEDTFYWRTKDVISGASEFVDTVTDFSLDDVLDLSEMFDFDDEEDDINDWVRLENMAGGQKLEVDLDGTGNANGWMTVANLLTTTMFDVEDLYDDGNLLVA